MVSSKRVNSLKVHNLGVVLLVPGVSEDRWVAEIESHVQYLKSCLSSLPGVDNGGIYRDRDGQVFDRVGRFSLNPPWYQDFYASFKRRPNHEDLYRMAHSHLLHGYWDIGGYIPPLVVRLSEERRNL